ncbi:GlcNac transferase [Thraustotheca clavata]|uniref:GlcNac transferase n=1 Tax=Thraustotheca clavata TaxID=74557 RepID=A0A1W0A4B2_9STRA|nr:GlcNac transferase [Thraustotheca clavata]
MVMTCFRYMIIGGIAALCASTERDFPTPTPFGVSHTLSYVNHGKIPYDPNNKQPNTDITLYPETQNIPLDPKFRDFRPPPPRVPASYDIFVGLSAFRDGVRCGKTIFTGFLRARRPDLLYFGVVDQLSPEDFKCLDEYCKLAKEKWPEEECKYKSHIKIDERRADESRGPTLARHYQQRLVGDQEFCLQLDAHSIFTIDWDVGIVEDWKTTDNEMAVLSTYLHDLNDFIGPNGKNLAPQHLPHICQTMRGGNGLVRNIGADLILQPKYPQMSALWGAGLSFSKCHAEKRVPIDPHTLWMFDGEEFLRASRLWTHGYDMYSPSRTGCVVYHNYTSVPKRFESIQIDETTRAQERERGINRFKFLVHWPFKGEMDNAELDKYQYGTARSLESYLEFSGITFDSNKTDKHSCRQLYWKPYEDPTTIEKLLPGWKMQAVVTPAPTTTALPKTTPLATIPYEVAEKTPKPLQLRADSQKKTPSKKRPPLTENYIGVLIVFIVAIAIVIYTNDGLWLMGGEPKRKWRSNAWKFVLAIVLYNTGNQLAFLAKCFRLLRRRFPEHSYLRAIWASVIYTLTVELGEIGNVFFGLSHPRLVRRTLASSFRLRTSDFKYGSHDRQALNLFGTTRNGPLRPVVVFIHGGAWAMTNKFHYSAVGQQLEHHNVLTVIANYRVFPYGDVEDMLADLEEILRWTIENIGAYGGDITNITLSGHSSGAHVAALLMLQSARRIAAKTPKEFEVAPYIQSFAGFCGPYDIDDHYEFESQRQIVFFQAHAISPMHPSMHGRKHFPIFSPSQLVTKGLVLPRQICLYHGTNDVVVPHSSTVKFAQALKTNGAHVQIVELPCGHVEPLLALMGEDKSLESPVYSTFLPLLQKPTHTHSSKL